MSVELNSVLGAYGAPVPAAQAAGQTGKTEDAEKSVVEATLEASKETPSKKDNYISSLSDEDRTSLVEKMKEDLEAMKLRFINTVKDSIFGQGKTAKKAEGDSIWDKIDLKTQEEAQAAIADDGYWGVEQTAQRMLTFAQSLTGGDPSKAEEMRQAFIKGYEEAEKVWGGKLPDISQKTYDRTMELFDEWAGVSSKDEDE